MSIIYYTMLQKLSKCEVKAWLCWNLIILPSLRFTWNLIFANFNGQKISFLAIVEVLNFDFLSKFQVPNWPKFQSLEHLKLPNMTFLDRLCSTKFDFPLNQSGGNMIKFQQSQALTSHFESFWSIVQWLGGQQTRLQDGTHIL